MASCDQASKPDAWFEAFRFPTSEPNRTPWDVLGHRSHWACLDPAVLPPGPAAAEEQDAVERQLSPFTASEFFTSNPAWSAERRPGRAGGAGAPSRGAGGALQGSHTLAKVCEGVSGADALGDANAPFDCGLNPEQAFAEIPLRRMDAERAAVREGFLVKRGHLVHNWKARWFVLMPDQLQYYKYEGGRRESSQRGAIPLKGCVLTCPYLEYENRPLVFRLQTASGAEHFLEACSREERDEWAAAVAAAAARLRADGGEPAPDQRSGAGSGSQNVDLSKVLDSMYDVHTGVRTGSHVEQGSSYSNCFTGSEAVDWLVFAQLAPTRVEAAALASALLEEGLLRTVGARSAAGRLLDDSGALYGFSDALKKRGCVRAEASLSAVELSGKVVRRGYLLKQGHRRKNWKVRLFVLRSEPSFLHYYDPTKDDVSPAGGFPLRGCLVSSLEDNGVPSGVRGNVQGNLFKIITQSDTCYFIQAPSHQEKMDWIDAIRGNT